MLWDVPTGLMLGLEPLDNLVLGQDIEVGNMFSIDPNTSRIWVEACHASVSGGSASTPTIKLDGTRVYVGDTVGNLLAVDASDCSTIWSLNLGFQIVGSIAVSSDNGEMYASTRDFIFQVFDDGAIGSLGWQAALTGLFENLTVGQSEFNLNLTSIGANGLGFQAGAGIIAAGVPFAVTTGMGVLDRDSGTVRYFTSGPEETVAAISTAGDGGFYIGNSPVRRALAIAFGLTTDPLVGGITKFAVQRHDLLMRDAVCAAEARAANAAANAGVCLDSVEADGVQLNELIAQVRDVAGPQALAKAEVTSGVWNRIDDTLTTAEVGLDDFFVGGDPAGLGAAANQFAAACRLLSPCPAVPRSDCRSAGVSSLAIRQDGGAKDKLVWKWKQGEPTSETEFADPTSPATTCFASIRAWWR